MRTARSWSTGTCCSQFRHNQPTATRCSDTGEGVDYGRKDCVGSSLIEQIFANAPFIQALGIELTAFGDGWCETRIQIVPSQQQQHGFVHAGVIMTLTDHTCGGAAATMAPEGRDVITIENKVSFLQ